MNRNCLIFCALALLSACGGKNGAEHNPPQEPTGPRFSFEGARSIVEVEADGEEEPAVCLQPQGSDTITGNLEFANDMEYQQGDQLFFALIEVDGGHATLLATKCVALDDIDAQTYTFEYSLEELNTDLSAVLMVKYHRHLSEDTYQTLGAIGQGITVSEGQQVVPDVNFQLELFDQ